VELKAERSRIKAVGTARAVRSVTLFPAAAGEVSAVNIAPNRKVKKGDVLLELDNHNEALAVELARVRVQNARQLLSRYEQTAGSGAVAESTVFDASTIAYNQAQQLYSQGLVGFLDVLVGERTLLQNGQSLADAAADVALAITDLYSAIGAPVTATL